MAKHGHKLRYAKGVHGKRFVKSHRGRHAFGYSAPRRLHGHHRHHHRVALWARLSLDPLPASYDLFGRFRTQTIPARHVPFFAHSGVLSSLPTVRGALIGPPAKTLEPRSLGQRPAFCCANRASRANSRSRSLAEQLPSGAGQHHHTPVVIIGDATKG